MIGKFFETWNRFAIDYAEALAEAQKWPRAEVTVGIDPNKFSDAAKSQFSR